MEVKITALGHACFLLEHEGYQVCIDPYADGMIPGLPALHVVADAVYCSHEHGDHNAREVVGLYAAEKPVPFTLEEYVTPHDDKDGALHGMNTVRIFDFSGLKIAHLGDIGCFPNEELAQALKGIDCMQIPVGGFYTIGCQTAYQIIKAAQPKVVIPMHYRTDNAGFDVLSHIDDFMKLWGSEAPHILTLDVNQHVHINK